MCWAFSILSLFKLAAYIQTTHQVYGHNGEVFHPFAFRTHAHQIGTVISGYRIRDGEWTLIGKKDPKLPQMFYPVENRQSLDYVNGDHLAMRCTMVSYRQRITYMGATNDDEMCNFYIMHYKTQDDEKKIRDMDSSVERVGIYRPGGLWNEAPEDVNRDASTFDGVFYPEGPLESPSV